MGDPAVRWPLSRLIHRQARSPCTRWVTQPSVSRTSTNITRDVAAVRRATAPTPAASPPSPTLRRTLMEAPLSGKQHLQTRLVPYRLHLNPTARSGIHK